MRPTRPRPNHAAGVCRGGADRRPARPTEGRRGLASAPGFGGPTRTGQGRLPQRNSNVRGAVALAVASLVVAAATASCGAARTEAGGPPARGQLACDGQRVVADIDIDPTYQEPRSPAEQAAAFAAGPDGRRATAALGPLKPRITYTDGHTTEVTLADRAGRAAAILRFTKIDGSGWRLVGSEACA